MVNTKLDFRMFEPKLEYTFETHFKCYTYESVENYILELKRQSFEEWLNKEKEQYANARIIETLEKCMCNCTYFFNGIGEQITICNRCSTIDKLKLKQEVQP
jgi:hypothetical protein